MKRILIIANTYYQMIVALQLKNTLFHKDKVVLILTDHSPNMDNIANRIEKLGIFERCCYVEALEMVSARNFFDKICDYFQISFQKDNRYSIYLENIENLYFDEIICYNFGAVIFGLYSKLYEYNKNIKVSIYEEGILSYSVKIEQTKRRKLINFTRQLLGKGTIVGALNYFYCFHKELYKGELTSVKIPEVDMNGKTAKELVEIFDLKSVNDNYQQKYIFFTSVYDFEGGLPIGEYDLVCKVAELVGHDNLLVKKHPRDKRAIYDESNLNIDNNSVVPWEAIQLAGDFSDKVYLTATSGSVMAGSFMAENPVKTYYLYPCCDISENRSAMKTAMEIERILCDENMKTVLSKVSIVYDIEEILR